MAFGAVAYIYAYRNKLQFGKLDALVLIYGGYLLVRNIFEPSNLLIGKYLFIGLGMYFITALLAARKETVLRILVYTLVALTAVTTIYGLIEYAVQDNFIYREYISEIVREPSLGIHRIGSTIGHPVPYGAFLLQALPFSILVWTRGPGKWWSYAGMATTLLAILALFFTYSKGSWLAALLIGGAVLLLGRGTRNRKVVLPALLLTLIVAAAAIVSWQQIRSETETRAEGSVDVRLVGWRAAIDGIVENPVVGVGFRQGEPEIQKHVDPEWYELRDHQLPVDNYYLSLFLEAGIIGIAIWMAIFVLILVEGIKVVKNRNPGWEWALASLASIIGISLNAFTFEAMHIWSNYIVFWMTAGIIHGINWRQATILPSSEIRDL